MAGVPKKIRIERLNYVNLVCILVISECKPSAINF